MNTEQLIRQLVKINACNDAIWWVKNQKHLSPKQLWEKCNFPDWMIWFLIVTSNKINNSPDLDSILLLLHDVIRIYILPHFIEEQHIIRIHTLHSQKKEQDIVNQIMELTQKSIIENKSFNVSELLYDLYGYTYSTNKFLCLYNFNEAIIIKIYQGKGNNRDNIAHRANKVINYGKMICLKHNYDNIVSNYIRDNIDISKILEEE